MMKLHGCTTEDTEGFVQHTLSLEGVMLGVLFVELSDVVKISIRSKGAVYVRDLAAKYGGGGHVYASGARIHKPLHEAIDAVVTDAAEFLAG